MDINSITVPKGTLRNRIIYLLENYPDLTRIEMAEILDKRVGTIYSYVSEIRKTQERQQKKSVVKETTATLSDENLNSVIETLKNEKKKPETTTQAPVQQAEPPVQATPPVEAQQVELPFDEPATMLGPVIEYEEEQKSLQPIKKSPETVELSLTSINGSHLQSLLFELLKNSVSTHENYSFAFTLEKSK